MAKITFADKVAGSATSTGRLAWNEINEIKDIVNVNDDATSSTWVLNEIPSGLTNGSNAIFLTSEDFIPETVQVFAGVARLSLLDDYNTSGNRTITLFQSPLTGENIRVSYIKL